MENQNYIHVFIAPHLGLESAGSQLVPIPVEGIPADLLPTLAQYTGLREGSHNQCELQLNCIPTWENVVLTAQGIVARSVVALAEKAERLAKEAQKYLEEDAKILELFAARDLSAKFPRPYANGHWHGLTGGSTDVNAHSDEAKAAIVLWRDEVQAKEKAENEERARIDAEKTKNKKAAYVAALTEFVTKHMPESLDRFHAHVLPLDEVVTIWRKQITPAIQAEAYTRRAPEGVITCDCHDNSDGDGESAVKSWERKKLDVLPPMTAAQFSLWKEFKKLEVPMKGAFVQVQVDEREARLSCRCDDPSWYSVRVTVTNPILEFTAHFDYEF